MIPLRQNLSILDQSRSVNYVHSVAGQPNHNQVHIAKISDAQNIGRPMDTKCSLPSSTVSNSLLSPIAIQNKDTVKEETFDLSAYMRSITHVSLIQNSELIRYDMCAGQSSYGPGRIPTIPPQSFVDDMEDW